MKRCETCARWQAIRHAKGRVKRFDPSKGIPTPDSDYRFKLCTIVGGGLVHFQHEYSLCNECHGTRHYYTIPVANLASFRLAYDAVASETCMAPHKAHDRISWIATELMRLVNPKSESVEMPAMSA